MKWLLITAVLVLITISANKPKSQNISYPVQKKTAGAVDISVSVVQLVPNQQPQFEIKFDTHSQELVSEIDKVSKLTDDKGNTYATSSWNGSAPGGHHREGTLTFTDKLPSQIKKVTLNLSDPVVEFIYEGGGENK